MKDFSRGISNKMIKALEVNPRVELARKRGFDFDGAPHMSK